LIEPDGSASFIEAPPKAEEKITQIGITLRLTIDNCNPDNTIIDITTATGFHVGHTSVSTSSLEVNQEGDFIQWPGGLLWFDRIADLR
jgi:hypothetical protein